MNIARPVRVAAATAITSMLATAAFAGPFAGSALAKGKPQPTPAVTGFTGPNQPYDNTYSQAKGAYAVFSWDVAANTSYTCSLDGAAQPCTPSAGVTKATQEYDNLPQGSHTFVLKATENPTGTTRYKPYSISYPWTVDTVPPVAPNVTQVTTPTSDNREVISFTPGDSSTSGFTCELDETQPQAQQLIAPQSCNGSFDTLQYGLLSDQTSYIARIVAYDAAQNTAESDTAWTVDMTKPATPYVIPPASPTNTNPSVVDFGLPVADPSGATFTCRLDNGTTGSCTDPYTSPTLADGLHTLTVIATDGAGNVSNPGSASWLVDTTPPPAPVIVNGPAETTNQTTATFTVSETEKSATLTCKLTGDADFGPCPSGMTWSGLGFQDYTLVVRATDLAGNHMDSAPYTWTISNTAPPPAYFLSGPADPSNSSSASFDFDATDPSLTSGFSCTLDGNAWPDSTTACDPTNGPVTVTGLSDGYHVFGVTADNNGTSSAAVTWAWHVDTQPPTPPVFSAAPPTISNSTSALFSYGSDVGVSFMCQLDSLAAAPCGGVSSFSNLDATQHTFTVTAMDAAGNTSSTSYTWTIDLGAPTAPTIVGPTGYVNTGGGTATWSDDDPSIDPSKSTCQLDNGAAQACDPSTPVDLSGLQDGPHTLVVTVENSNGDPAAQEISWVLDTQPPSINVDPIASPTNAQTIAPSISVSDANPDGYSCSLLEPSGSTIDNCGAYQNLPEGDYVLTVKATDLANNSATPVPVAFTIDRTAPVVTVQNVPSGTVNTTSFTPTISTDDGSAFTCDLTGPTPSSDCGQQSALADGQYTFTVTSTDKAGNTGTNVSSFVVDTHAPTAALTAPRSLTGAAVLTWSENVTGLDIAQVAMHQADTGSVVATTAACFTAAAARVNCATSNAVRTVRLKPTRPLMPGQHYLVSAAAGAATDAATNPSASFRSAMFRGHRSLEENSIAVRASWQRVNNRAAYGHSYLREHLAGARASWRFRGSSVSWITVTGPTQGKAVVLVDGHKKATVDNYATSTHFKVARKFGHLGSGRHVLTVRALGVKGAKAGKGTFVAVDAFKVGTKRTNSPRVSATLHRVTSSSLYHGHAAATNLARSSVTVRFRGTSVRWFTVRNRYQGKARVYVDGVLKSTVDNYSSSTMYKVRRMVRGLADTVHTLKIVVLGRHHAGARGNTVTVDRVVVG